MVGLREARGLILEVLEMMGMVRGPGSGPGRGEQRAGAESRRVAPPRQSRRAPERRLFGQSQNKA